MKTRCARCKLEWIVIPDRSGGVSFKVDDGRQTDTCPVVRDRLDRVGILGDFSCPHRDEAVSVIMDRARAGRRW